MHKRTSIFRRAFTVGELLVCIAVLGILAAGAIPIYAHVKEQAEIRTAISKACSLNAAKQSYKIRVRDADTNWAAASSAASKFTLLYSAGMLPMSDPSFDTFRGAYLIDLGTSLDTKVELRSASGTLISY